MGIDPEEMARNTALQVASQESEVGEFVASQDLGDGVTDFRFKANIAGYESWQWSVTLYHDVEADRWTVDESSLIPAQGALLPPRWVPWKERLLPQDLSVTDVMGTDDDDTRLEDGFRKVQSDDVNDDAIEDESDDRSENSSDDSQDVMDVVAALQLSRRKVLSPLGRSEAAKRWYAGQGGPKSLSTKAAEGHTCDECGFYIPLSGELGTMFGVCANRWSPDDGRVVSLDHGCGEHSDITPPEMNHLWVQSEPAFDDLHIDVVKQAPRDEHPEVEIIEQLQSSDDEDAVSSDNVHE